MDNNVIQLAARKTPLRIRDYSPIPFFIENDIKYEEFRQALKAAGMRIVSDPLHPGSHVVVRTHT
jgi:hypothetical protein